MEDDNMSETNIEQIYEKLKNEDTKRADVNYWMRVVQREFDNKYKN